jgi:septum site-determining protein MinC
MTNNPQDPGPCFELKSHSLSLIFAELYYFDEQDFESLMGKKIGQAPGFFRDAPLIIDLEKYRGLSEELNFFSMIALSRRYNMHIVGVRSSDKRYINKAKSAGLAILQPIPERKPKPDSGESAAIVESVEPSVQENQTAPTMIIGNPVRSGQKIEAPEGDLIVMGPVQHGAEILAAGNIHVYGPLRGRALAGMHGDKSAFVFCQSLEAELISIAGQYKISEDLQGENWKVPARLHLADGQLILQSLVN